MRLRTANTRARRPAQRAWIARNLPLIVRAAVDDVIDALEARYAGYGPGGWRWDAARPDAYDLTEVLGCDDATYEPVGGLTTRVANVTVRITPELYEALREGRRINWRGVAWRAGLPEVRRDDWRGNLATLRLETVCPRDWTPADIPAHRR